MLLSSFGIKDGVHIISCDIHQVSFILSYSHWEYTIYFGRLAIFHNFQHVLEHPFVVILVKPQDTYESCCF